MIYSNHCRQFTWCISKMKTEKGSNDFYKSPVIKDFIKHVINTFQIYR